MTTLAAPAPEDTWPISTAARMLGVSVGTLRNWDRAGKIHSTRLGDKRRFSQAELERVAATMPART
jgi:excisionase family DNA binding protein